MLKKKKNDTREEEITSTKERLRRAVFCLINHPQLVHEGFQKMGDEINFIKEIDAETAQLIEKYGLSENEVLDLIKEYQNQRIEHIGCGGLC
jgi:hypothetical protein